MTKLKGDQIFVKNIWETSLDFDNYYNNGVIEINYSENLKSSQIPFNVDFKGHEDNDYAEPLEVISVKYAMI